MTQIGLECFFDSIITWLISSKIIKIENFSSFVLSYSHKLLKRKLMDDMINRHDSIAEENMRNEKSFLVECQIRVFLYDID